MIHHHHHHNFYYRKHYCALQAIINTKSTVEKIVEKEKSKLKSPIENSKVQSIDHIMKFVYTKISNITMFFII